MFGKIVVIDWIVAIAFGILSLIILYVVEKAGIKPPVGNFHDYTNRYWGHDYTFTPSDDGMKAKMIGWGHGIAIGDYLILQHPEGGQSCYRVEQIVYMRDPSDMWSASVVFSPREVKR